MKMEQDQQQRKAGQGEALAAPAVAQRRNAMPIVAAFIDQCRETYGAEMVNRQLATAQQAAREHAQVLTHQGEAAARRWHRANAHRCTFHATEAGRIVGLASPFGQSETAITAACVATAQSEKQPTAAAEKKVLPAPSPHGSADSLEFASGWLGN